MPVLIAVLLTGLRYLFLSRIGLFIATALVWLGVNFITMKVVIEPAIAMLQSFAQGGGGSGAGEYWTIATQWAGVLNFDRALSMVVSAYVTHKALSASRLFLAKRG